MTLMTLMTLTTLDIHSNSDTSGFHVPSALVNITYIPTVVVLQGLLNSVLEQLDQTRFSSVLQQEVRGHCSSKLVLWLALLLQEPSATAWWIRLDSFSAHPY
jgi:hypothetical protein